MMNIFEQHLALKEKIRAGQPTLGLFIRTPAPQIVESLAQTGLDFVALDAEHAPFGINALDTCILAARASGIPVLVRVPEATSSKVLSVLDMGAAGIIVPHVKTAGEALESVAASRYVGGTRGFSGAHRAAAYGAMPADTFKKKSDASTIVIDQIEDADGVKNIDEIAAVSTLDAVFIGRADLANSLGAATPDDPAVDQAVDGICKASLQAGRTIGMYLSTTDDIKKFRAKGVSLFIISTDQGLLVKAARTVAEDFKGV
ncbi:MAG: aldolase [Alphaproteobacteria bacterium]|nr:MAG: aldolase [Alphaproteobacteria bacterium]